VAYESRMLGLFAIYFGPSNEIAYKGGFPKTNDLFLGFSRDGITWERPDRTAFLRCSRQPGTWNRGYLHSAAGLCLIVGLRLPPDKQVNNRDLAVAAVGLTVQSAFRYKGRIRP